MRHIINYTQRPDVVLLYIINSKFETRTQWFSASHDRNTHEIQAGKWKRETWAEPDVRDKPCLLFHVTIASNTKSKSCTWQLRSLLHSSTPIIHFCFHSNKLANVPHTWELQMAFSDSISGNTWNQLWLSCCSTSTLISHGVQKGCCCFIRWTAKVPVPAMQICVKIHAAVAPWFLGVPKRHKNDYHFSIPLTKFQCITNTFMFFGQHVPESKGPLTLAF